MAQPLLQLDNISKSFGGLQCISHLDIDVREGEVVSVIGPNGAGKSTLLRTVAGGITPRSGDIRFEGASIAGSRAERVARLGIALVPEGRHIFGNLTVAENLRVGATVRRRGDDVRADIDRLVDLFPVLSTYYRSPAGRLSGGEQQQLAIARALIGRPRLLMLDEPSLGLAPAIVDRVFETLEILRGEGTTILLVEQMATRAVEFAERSYIVRNGRVVLEGTRAELLATDGVQEAFFGFAPA
jgi:branched-chain amino acid transport system ATP-binding protein